MLHKALHILLIVKHIWIMTTAAIINHETVYFAVGIIKYSPEIIPKRN